jgi:hypothetical protein
MSGLSGFLQSDIADLGVFGLEAINGILGEVAALPANNPARMQLVQRLQAAAKQRQGGLPTANLTAKAEFEKRLQMLPKNMQAELMANRLQIVDANYYGHRLIGGTAGVEILANADVKTYGVCNINARKLDADMPFLLTGIVLLSGVGSAGDSTQGDIVGTTFGVCSGNILNGQVEMRVGSEVILPEMSCNIFDTTSRTDLRRGYYKLENPKWIEPQKEIIPELKLGASETAKTYVKIVLIGATVAKK